MIRSYYSQSSSLQSPYNRERMLSYLKKALIYLMGPFMGLWLMASQQDLETEKENKLFAEDTESVTSLPVSSVMWLFHP